MGNELLLEKIQFPVFLQSFDGQDLSSLDLSCQDQTGRYSFPVQDDRTGPAFSLRASFLGSRQPQILS